MAANPKVTFIGAGSTVFMKNIVGDILQRPALAGATIRLMDINPTRLEESEIIVAKHRNGDTGSIFVKNALHVFRFDPLGTEAHVEPQASIYGGER